MKFTRHIALLSLLLLAPAFLTAEPKKDRPANPPAKQKPADTTDTLDEIEPHPQINLSTLEKLLKMSPEELTEMRMTLRKIEQMPLTEKAQLLTRIRKFKKMQREKQESMKKAVQNMLPEHRTAMTDYWDSMSQEEGQEMRKLVNKMSPEERDKWRQGIYKNAARKLKQQGNVAAKDKAKNQPKKQTASK